MDGDDGWDVFGGSDDDDSNNQSETNDTDLNHPSAVPFWLQQITQTWMMQNAGGEEVLQNIWSTALAEKKIQVVHITNTLSASSFGQPTCDAMIVCPASNDQDKPEKMGSFLKEFRRLVRMVIPGGIILLPSNVRATIVNSTEKQEDWIYSELVSTDSSDAHGWGIMQRRACSIQWKTCRWLPSNYDVKAEFERARQAAVPLSINEQRTRKLTPQSIKRAVKTLQQYGYCIITGGLIDPQQSDFYGKASLSDLHQVADILQEEKGLQILESGAISEEAAVYREISQREHFRVDIRHGPSMEKLRGEAGNAPCTVTALVRETGDFLRGNADLLEIIRRVMNPVDDKLSPGNFGRYNFEGCGPDGSFQDIRVGPVGAIVTWPGATDQALHADTPHLFEHLIALPAHYINVFTPGSMVEHDDDEHKVGQTAFLHETHKLDVTAIYEGNSLQGEATSTVEMWRKHLVRPKLQIGDVVLFDCRILHFGLPNESEHATFRPLLYTNVTMHWFHDPKNWDNEKRIFKNEN